MAKARTSFNKVIDKYRNDPEFKKEENRLEKIFNTNEKDALLLVENIEFGLKKAVEQLNSKKLDKIDAGSFSTNGREKRTMEFLQNTQWLLNMEMFDPNLMKIETAKPMLRVLQGKGVLAKNIEKFQQQLIRIKGNHQQAQGSKREPAHPSWRDADSLPSRLAELLKQTTKNTAAAAEHGFEVLGNAFVGYQVLEEVKVKKAQEFQKILDGKFTRLKVDGDLSLQALVDADGEIDTASESFKCTKDFLQQTMVEQYKFPFSQPSDNEEGGLSSSSREGSETSLGGEPIVRIELKDETFLDLALSEFIKVTREVRKEQANNKEILPQQFINSIARNVCSMSGYGGEGFNPKVGVEVDGTLNLPIDYSKADSRQKTEMITRGLNRYKALDLDNFGKLVDYDFHS